MSDVSGALRRLGGPCAWTAYIAVPAGGWSWLNGLPLGPFEALCIALVWWVWAVDRKALDWRLLAALVAVKVLASTVLVAPGFSARYYANQDFAPPVERSLDLRSHDVTRRDERIAFGGPERPDLPVHFFNDLRFNFDPRTGPDRHALAYSVQWNGFVRQQGAPQARTFYLELPPGATGELSLDGRVVVPPVRSDLRTATVGPGWHELRVRVSAPYGSRREIEAGEIVDSVRRPLGGRDVTDAPIGPSRLRFDRLLRRLAALLDVIVLAWLGSLVVSHAVAAWRGVRLAPLLWLGAIVESMLFAAPYAHRMVTLTGTDDPLFYDHVARVIAFGDVLLQAPGPAGGQGGPYYYQPGYSYFLALTHRLFGDSVFGAILVQRLLLAATVAWVGLITRRLFGSAAGWVAVIGGALFLFEKGGPWTTDLMSETVFMPLVAAWTWLLVRGATERPSWGTAVAAGVLGGGATCVRSTLVLAWPLAIGTWWTSIRGRQRRTTAVLLLVMCAVFGMVTLRNYIVAHRIVLLNTSGGPELLKNNPPPREFIAPVERARVYEAFGLRPNIAPVIEYALQAPGEFAWHLGRKAVYAFGLFELSGIRPEAKGSSLWYVGLWCAALVGMTRVVRSPGTRATAAVALPALVAFSHLFVIVLFNPHTAGDRMMLPMFPLLIPYAAFALEPAAGWARRHVSLVTIGLLTALALWVFAPIGPRADDVLVVLVLAAAILAVAAGPRSLFGRAAWLYAGYVAGVLLMLATGSRARDMRYELLLPAAAFAAARLSQEKRVRDILMTSLFAGAMGAVVIGEMGRMVSASAARTMRVFHLATVAVAAFAWWVRQRPGATAAAAGLAGAGATAVFVWSLTADDSARLGPEALAAALTDRIGVLGAASIVVLWIRAASTSAAAVFSRSARAHSRQTEGSPATAMCHGALLAGLVLAAAGAVSASPASGAAGYPLVALGLLFGLAESTGIYSPP